MIADFKVGQGDTARSIAATLYDELNVAINLTGAESVQFRMRLADLSRPVITGNVVVTDVANGGVRYDWAAGQTEVPGLYRVQWVVTWPGGRPESFANSDISTLWIEPRV